MKKTFFLSSVLSVLLAAPSMAAYTLDDAVGYAYYDNATRQWVSHNLTWSAAENGGGTITSGNGNFGNGYNVTVAITVDSSLLGNPTAAREVFSLNGWGLGVNTNGCFTGTTGASGNLAYYTTGASATAPSGYTTIVITESNSGTRIFNSINGYYSKSELRGSNSASVSTATVGAYAAGAIKGIAFWGSNVYSSSGDAAAAHNALSEAVGPLPAYVSQTPGNSIGRVTFIGDSITEGYGDQTWRYALFKTLVDNGVEYDIAGLRTGYAEGHLPANPESSYRGVEFENTHLGKSSGRTYGLIHGSGTADSVSGVTGVHSGDAPYNYSIKDAANLNSDTYIMMIGTNDLLSDVDRNASPDAFAAVIQNLLGGEVQYENGKYSRTATPGDSGNMGTLLDALKVAEANDVVYLMDVPTWSTVNGTHGANDTAREAVSQYNGLLKEWVAAYNADNPAANVVLIDINDGLVDVTTGKFQGAAGFFSASDGLHPNTQGSLIIASNLAAGMHLAGRTAGLERRWSASFDNQMTRMLVGSEVSRIAQDAFDPAMGYTVAIDLAFGNGAEGGWSADSFTLASGNGAVSGALTVTEGYIKWGDQILFCRDMSQNAETLTISYVAGDESKNLHSGYYVWLDDKLIGEGLAVAEGQDAVLNGIDLSATQEFELAGISWTQGSYAPGTANVPEPATATLSLLALAALAVRRRRKTA